MKKLRGWIALVLTTVALNMAVAAAGSGGIIDLDHPCVQKCGGVVVWNGLCLWGCAENGVYMDCYYWDCDEVNQVW